MAWGRRLTCAFAVFVLGSIAALPFYHPPRPADLPAADSAVPEDCEAPSSVALQIPADDLAVIAVDPNATTNVAATSNVKQSDVAKPSNLERQVEPPIISTEFPRASQEVPRAVGKTSPIPEKPRDQVLVVEPQGDGPRTHRIRDGDTLRGIAEKYLKNGDRWIEILEANRTALRDPDVLPVGKVIEIPDRSKSSSSGLIETRQPERKTQDQPLTPLVPIRSSG